MRRPELASVLRSVLALPATTLDVMNSPMLDLQRRISLTLGMSLLLTGCGGSSAPAPKKVVKIDASTVADQAASQQALPQPAPVAARQPADRSASSKSESRKRAKKKSGELQPAAELGPGDELFALLDPSAPSGVPFEIDGGDAGANVDRFAYVPVPPGSDSTKFAVTEGDVQAGIARQSALLKDDSAAEYELPEGFTAIESAGYSASGLPWRIRGDEDGAVMALIPEGVFIQGGKTGPANVRPEHGVLLDAFYIDLREVTYGRYDKYRESISEKRKVPRAARPPGDAQEPVMGVTWAEAHAFANWAGKDLPTEAQWEKAARGPDGFLFPWGNGRFVWHRPREPGQIDRVGSFKGDISPYGVFDMAGNAREWCKDWYVDKYYSQLVAESGATARNPKGPKAKSGTNQRVVKGGDPDWHVWARAGVVQSERPQDTGFRCVLNLNRAGEKEKGKKAK